MCQLVEEQQNLGLTKYLDPIENKKPSLYFKSFFPLGKFLPKCNSEAARCPEKLLELPGGPEPDGSPMNREPPVLLGLVSAEEGLTLGFGCL